MWCLDSDLLGLKGGPYPDNSDIQTNIWSCLNCL